MTTAESAPPHRISGNTVTIAAILLAVLVVALTLFVFARGGDEGRVPGTATEERGNPGSGGGQQDAGTGAPR